MTCARTRENAPTILGLRKFVKRRFLLYFLSLSPFFSYRMLLDGLRNRRGDGIAVW